MTTYRISTNSVVPLDDAPEGSYSWMPMESDRALTMVEVKTVAELAAAVAAAVAEHFAVFPDAVACKPFVAKARRGDRHVSGGKAFSEIGDRTPMVRRTAVAA